MIEKLITWDKEIFHAINGLHTPALDQVMFYSSQTYIWIPFYAVLIYFVIRRFGKQAWIPIIAITLTIALSDQLTSGVMKPWFQRYRPTHDPTIENIHTVNDYKGGKFGFASSHAANTFALATFFWLLFRDRRQWVSALFLWAVFVTYTRIYLGVHFPGDVLVGALVGMICAIATYLPADKLAGGLLSAKTQ